MVLDEILNRLRTLGIANSFVDIATYLERDALYEICDIAQRQADEIKRLQSIVDKLLKTADGVPIVPDGTQWVYVRQEDGQPPYEMRVTHTDTFEWISGTGGDGLSHAYLPDCYSTLEAAMAAPID